MSYILDALRRADAERERGSVPGLHAQLVPTHSADEPAPRRGGMPAWAGFAGGALAVAAAIGAWQWMAHDDKRTEANAATPAPRPVTDATDGRVAMSPPPQAPQSSQDVQALPSTPPAPTAAPAPVQRPAVNIARAPAPSPAPARAPATVDSTAAAGRKSGPATPPPAQVRATAAAPAEDHLYAVNELPDNLRREWPTLSVGGSMFAGDAASRFVIINGQILHEGERLAPELSLEEIRLKAAVLRFKGYRVLIRF